MGQTLSSPVTTKHSDSGGDERYMYSVSEMQGWRISMEDAHATVLNLEDDKVDEVNTFFAVYDGHGGGAVARFSGGHVHKRLVSEESYQEKEWATALKKAFLGTDEDIRADPNYFHDPSGCTAVAALVTADRKIFVANAGDSRSVLSVKGEVKPLSYDHKPQSETELTRIRNAGGYIEYGRVNGNLALSRAIGDFEFKKNYTLSPEQQIITADPDIIEHQITDDDEFLVLACDGIWDCLTSQQVVDIIRLQVAQRKELYEIGEFICDLCLAPDTSSGAGIGCDNMTIMIVAILNGRTKIEWYNWIADRVENNYGYETPTEVPQIYAPSRINAFRSRRQAYDERDRERNNDNSGSAWNAAPRAFGIARSMFGGGLTFHPGTGIVTDGNTLMFSNDESDEDDSGDDDSNLDSDGRSFLSSLASRRPGSSDITKTLKQQLKELEDDGSSASKFQEVDGDGDAFMHESDDDAAEAFGTNGTSSYPETDKFEREAHDDERGETLTPLGPRTPNGIHGETPLPPPPVKDEAEIKQFESVPGLDEPSPAVKAEGLMDASESSLKA